MWQCVCQGCGQLIMGWKSPDLVQVTFKDGRIEWYVVCSDCKGPQAVTLVASVSSKRIAR